jgi:hypothetical protein
VQLPGKHTLAAESEGEARHWHGVPPQSPSAKHVSYEHWGAQDTPGVGRQRPFLPAVQSASERQPPGAPAS